MLATPHPTPQYTYSQKGELQGLWEQILFKDKRVLDEGTRQRVMY